MIFLEIPLPGNHQIVTEKKWIKTIYALVFPITEIFCRHFAHGWHENRTKKSSNFTESPQDFVFFFFSKCTRNIGFSSLRLTMKTSTESSRDFCDSWIFSWTLIGTQIFLIQKSYTAHTEMLNMNAKKKGKKRFKRALCALLKKNTK